MDKYVTEHGKQRINQRINNQTNRDPDDLAKIALEEGVPIEKLRGGLYRWADKRRYKYDDTLVRLFRNHLYIFSYSKPRRLITVIPVPKKFKNISNRIERKRKRNLL